MEKYLPVLYIVIGLALGGLIAKAFWPTFETKYETKTVEASLTQAQLDSLKLGFKAEFQAELKPVIITTRDTAQVRTLIDEIISLRKQLVGKADLSLEYYTDRMLPYGDTLYVKADFVVGKTTVVFRPTARKFSLPVLTPITFVFDHTGDSWPTRAVIFLSGVIVTLLTWIIF